MTEPERKRLENELEVLDGYRQKFLDTLSNNHLSFENRKHTQKLLNDINGRIISKNTELDEIENNTAIKYLRPRHPKSRAEPITPFL